MDSQVISLISVERCPRNPIIWPGMPGLEGKAGDNINGPTLVRVPPWVECPLGKYYLYFGHHRGTFIRLAYAEDPTGPYTIFKPGILSLREVGKIIRPKPHHIASPEIWLDPAQQTIRLYFHADTPGTGIYHDQGQMSFVATSPDGLLFTPHGTPLAPFYLRVFQHHDFFYGIAKNDNIDGMLVRSPDGLHTFARGACFVPGFRHCGLYSQDPWLHVFFTRAGDAPERIFLSTVDLRPDWNAWALTDPFEVLRPELEWEGAHLPVSPSKYGGTQAANALRDPHVFVDGNLLYLLYTVQGEGGIAIAQLKF